MGRMQDQPKTDYHDLSSFSDWVAEAKKQRTLFPLARPGPETQRKVREVLGFHAGPESPAVGRGAPQSGRQPLRLGRILDGASRLPDRGTTVARIVGSESPVAGRGPSERVAKPDGTGGRVTRARRPRGGRAVVP